MFQFEQLPDFFETRRAGFAFGTDPDVSALLLRVVAFSERLPARPLVYLPRAGGRC
jgi:hypothetical protein